MDNSKNGGDVPLSSSPTRGDKSDNFVMINNFFLIISGKIFGHVK